VTSDKNGDSDIDCASGCNVTCWRSGTEITSTNWDYASNTTPAVITSYGDSQQAQVKGSFILDLRALNSTWDCRAWVKDKGGNGVTAVATSLFIVAGSAAYTSDSSACSWAALIPGSSNNLASACGSANYITYTHEGNTPISFTFRAHAKTDSCSPSCTDGNLKSSNNAIPVSNLRVNGGSTCAAGSGTTLSTTATAVNGLTNIERGTYPTPTTAKAYQCITIPANTPSGTYTATVDVISANA